jgi:hypothetical protein
MVWTPEDLANLLFPHGRRKVPVISTLLKHPNNGVTAEEINEELGFETNSATIDETQRVLREIENLLEISTRKKGVGRPLKIYKPGSLMDTYHDPIFSFVLGEEREGYADSKIVAAIHCNKDPMKCPDSKCRICTNGGIKTCWDRMPDKGSPEADKLG